MVKNLQHNPHTSDALARGQERFRNAFLSSSEAVALVRLDDGVFTDINEMFSLLTGYGKAEIFGAQWRSVPLLSDEDEHYSFLDRVIAVASIFNQVVKIKGQRQDICTALLSAMIMPLDDIDHVLLILRNIDDIEKAQEALEVSESRFRELFNHMSSGVVVLQDVDQGRDFILVDINRAAEKIENVRREDLIGNSVDEVFPSVRKFGLLDVYRRVLKTGRPEIYPVTVYRGNKLLVWKENYIYKLPSGEIIDVYDDITGRKQAEEQLFQYQERLQSLTSELSLFEERERRNIATDLHDHIGQTLSVIKMKCHLLANKLGNGPYQDDIAKIKQLTQDAITDTRSLTSELSPPVLFELGLESAVEWLADYFSTRHGLRVVVNSEGGGQGISEDLGILLFRSVQELLMNVVKHAAAAEAVILIKYDDHRINIEVKDEGMGFDPELYGVRQAEDYSFGLFNISERMRYVGGVLDINSVPGQGTTIILIAPFE